MHVTGPGCQPSYHGSYYNRDRFPEGTRGFIYYRPPNPGTPSVAGNLRFRLTPGNNPASFIQGSDLRMPNGLPWGIPLLLIAVKYQSHNFIRQQLIDDGLVTPTLLETSKAMMTANKHAPGRSSRIIHSFGQLFHINFDIKELEFYLLTANSLWCSTFKFFGEGEARDNNIISHLGEYIGIAWLYQH